MKYEFTIGLLRSDAHDAVPDYLSVSVESDYPMVNPQGHIILEDVSWEHVSEDGSGHWLYRPIGSWL